MPIEKVLSTYGLSFLDFLVSLVLWILYGFEKTTGLLIAAIVTTCLFVFMGFLSHKILFPNKRYVLTANHIFYM
ncbi:MAG: hypothetical protein K2N42_02010, partial [Anaeroplasmataceae bacterium]|nr:hypothetical protein [Anaeroplasmataceae bacterium]